MSHIAVTRLEYVFMDLDDAGTASVNFKAPHPLQFRAGQHGVWVVPQAGRSPLPLRRRRRRSSSRLGRASFLGVV